MDIVDHKASVRERVWNELRKVAVPDSRFHFDFGEFIADFEEAKRPSLGWLNTTSIRTPGSSSSRRTIASTAFASRLSKTARSCS